METMGKIRTNRAETASRRAQGRYYNFSGCGNTLNYNHPVVRDLIIDCLSY